MTLTKSQGNCLKVAGVVLDGEQGNVFYFLPRQITVINCLIETGVVGIVDGSNPNVSFYYLNRGSIQFSFLFKIDICLSHAQDNRVPWYSALGGRRNLQNREMKS